MLGIYFSCKQSFSSKLRFTSYSIIRLNWSVLDTKQFVMIAGTNAMCNNFNINVCSYHNCIFSISLCSHCKMPAPGQSTPGRRAKKSSSKLIVDCLQQSVFSPYSLLVDHLLTGLSLRFGLGSSLPHCYIHSRDFESTVKDSVIRERGLQKGIVSAH